MIRTALRYLGPSSPWGPALSGIATLVVAMLGTAILAPPILWVGKSIIGPWWKFWLG